MRWSTDLSERRCVSGGPQLSLRTTSSGDATHTLAVMPPTGGWQGRALEIRAGLLRGAYSP